MWRHSSLPALFVFAFVSRHHSAQCVLRYLSVTRQTIQAGSEHLPRCNVGCCHVMWQTDRQTDRRAAVLLCCCVKTRLNVLACVDRLLDCLDKMAIIDDILPFLADIQTTEVDIIMTLVGQYQCLSICPSLICCQWTTTATCIHSIRIHSIHARITYNRKDVHSQMSMTI